MYHCQCKAKGVDKGYFGVLSQASDKLLLQYWYHCNLLTVDCKSQVVVIYIHLQTPATSVSISYQHIIYVS